jgi:hypothetical protein
MYSDYKPRFRLLQERAQVRVQGPIQQRRGSEGYWAGAFTPDELRQLGIEAIEAAAELDRRKRERFDKNTGLPHISVAAQQS